jgi:hypothetical protein
MQPNRRLLLGAVVLVIGIAAGIARSPVHAQQQLSNADVLPALLAEVRGLRAALEQMASANAHAQLLVGRLQLQETRMAGMIRRLDTVRDSLASARGTYEHLAGSLKQFENDKGPESGGGVPEEEKDNMLRGLRAGAAAAKANVDRLAAEENQLTVDLTAEQSRWIDINQRLDELEKSLRKQ